MTDAARYNVELVLRTGAGLGFEGSGDVTFLLCGQTYRFNSIMELTDLIEAAARQDCPHLEIKARSFTRSEPKKTIPPPEQALRRREARQTFHIVIQFAENYTWQGTVHWLEGRKSRHFRSFLELLRLVDGAARAVTDESAVPIGL